MVIHQPAPIQQSKLARTNPNLAMKMDLLWREANTLKAKEGAKRLEHVCNHYDQLTPETTYRWIDPIGLQHEVEDSLAHSVAGWHTIRNCVSVLPLILTGIALYFALTAYQQDRYQGDAGKSFLQLWQEGFHGGTPLTPSTTVAIDVGLLVVFFILIWITSSLDGRAYSRSTKFAQKLQTTTEELMSIVANNRTIHTDKKAITNVANAVQQVVDNAMRANQQIIRDTMDASQQVTTIAENSVAQASKNLTMVGTSLDSYQEQVTTLVDVIKQLIIISIDTQQLQRQSLNVQARREELAVLGGQLSDLTNAIKQLTSVSSHLELRSQLLAGASQEESAILEKDVAEPDDIKSLSLFAIARATLEEDDRALIGKVYSVQAGISQSKPENFEGESFDLSVRTIDEPLPFDILLHASENIKLTTEWQQHLRYDPRNLGPQLVEFAFQVIVPGHSTLVVDFYQNRRWLRTIRFAFDAVEQSQLTAISSEE